MEVKTVALSLFLAAGLHQGRAEWRQLDARIAAFDAEFARMAREDAAARRLATIPGIGVINATALVAALRDARSFARGRDLSAWLGSRAHPLGGAAGEDRRYCPEPAGRRSQAAPHRQRGGRHPGDLELQPDVTLAELQTKLKDRGLRVGLTSIWRFFQRRHITLKRRPRMRPSSSAAPSSLPLQLKRETSETSWAPLASCVSLVSLVSDFSSCGR